MKKTKELEDQMDVILVELSIGRLSIPLAAGKARNLLAQVDKEARIDELKRLQKLHTRTYHQTVTDNNGSVYVDETHLYISEYETRERIAALTEDKDNG